MPLTTGPVTGITPAPAVAALPAATPVRVVRAANPAEDYAYLDRASAMSDALGQAPPDYGFDYQDVRPWVWRSANHSVTLVEPVEGGYRYYYYRPDAEQPYLVRDPQYSYGYSDGQLVAVYDSDGRLLPLNDIEQRVDYAGRYLARAIALYQAAGRNERHAVNAANWAARRAEIDAARSQWEAQQSQQAAWRAYHDEHQAEEQAYWQGERAQRERTARAFDEWSGRGFAGPPPVPANYRGRSDGGAPADQAAHHETTGNRPYPAQANPQQNPADEARRQQAQADAQRAQQDAVARARQQQSQADAAQQARTQAALAKARQQQDQLARQSQDRENAVAAQKQNAQAAAAQAQQQAQAARAAQEAARHAQQAQANAAREASAQAQQRALADARRQQAQQEAQARAAASANAQKAQADAVAARQKEHADAASKQNSPAPPVKSPAQAKPEKAAPNPAGEKHGEPDDAHKGRRRDGAAGPPTP